MNRIYTEEEYRLFTPGPINIPNRVAHAAALANYHHRTASFRHILKDTLENLKPLFGTKCPILPVHATGRGTLEGVYTSLFSSRDTVISVANGSFGEMAVKTLNRNGIPCVPCFAGWETPVDIATLEKIIVENKPTAITTVWNDTSTGVVNPIREIGALARKYGLLFVADTVSGLGCMPFRFDEWGVDAAVVASQKGLMSPVGISFVAVSDRALEACDKNDSHRFYINLSDIFKNISGKGETPGSTPVSLILSVNEALNMINDEGLENVFKRHKALSRGTKNALEALGFSLYPFSCAARSDSLTVARVPEGVSSQEIATKLADSYHILISKGLGNTAGNHVRIAHLGHCHVEDMLQCVAALEAALDECGIKDTFGKGTKAFLEAYRNTLRGE